MALLKGGGFLGVGIWKNKAENEGEVTKKGIILIFLEDDSFFVCFRLMI